MKRTLCIITLLLAFTFVKAQGNLQFSQVKLVSTTQTVPAGKVWKVESAHISQTTCLFTFAGTCVSNSTTTFVHAGIYIVNGTSCYLGMDTGGDQLRYSVSSDPFPLWLPATTTLAAGTNIGFLSVIEFNIIP